MSAENSTNKISIRIKNAIESGHYALPNPNTSNGRAVIHNLLSLDDGISLHALLEIVRSNSPDFEAVDYETTLKLQKIRNQFINTKPNDLEILELSPVIPRGLVQFLTETSPTNIAHATGGNFDVVSDPTIGLALLVNQRRREREKQPLAMAVFQRCLRLQTYEVTKGYTPHFEMLGTIHSSEGYTKGKFFAIDTITSLVEHYSGLITTLVKNGNLEISIGHLGITGKIIRQKNGPDLSKDFKMKIVDVAMEEDNIPCGRVEARNIDYNQVRKSLEEYNVGKELAQLERLALSLEKIGLSKTRITVKLNRIDGIGHYSGLAFTIYMPDGKDVVDGGAVDWVARLTQNTREFSVVSGMGTEFFAKNYMNTLS